MGCRPDVGMSEPVDGLITVKLLNKYTSVLITYLLNVVIIEQGNIQKCLFHITIIFKYFSTGRSILNSRTLVLTSCSEADFFETDQFYSWKYVPVEIAIRIVNR